MPTAWRPLVTSLVPMMWIEENSNQNKASLHSGLRVGKAQPSQTARLSQTSAAHQDPNNDSRSFRMLCGMVSGASLVLLMVRRAGGSCSSGRGFERNWANSSNTGMW